MYCGTVLQPALASVLVVENVIAVPAFATNCVGALRFEVSPVSMVPFALIEIPRAPGA